MAVPTTLEAAKRHEDLLEWLEVFTNDIKKRRIFDAKIATKRKNEELFGHIRTYEITIELSLWLDHDGECRGCGAPI